MTSELPAGDINPSEQLETGSGGPPARKSLFNSIRPGNGKTKRAHRVLGALLASFALAVLVFWVLTFGKETTDDAQVESHVVTVSARVAAEVAKVLVLDNQAVHVGDVLIELDRREIQARYDAAKADELSAGASLALAEAQLGATEKNTSAMVRQAKGGVSQASSGVTSTRTGLDQAKADVMAATSRYNLALLELQRIQGLFNSGSISEAEVDARKTALDQAQAQLDQARARERSAVASIAGSVAVVEQAEGRLAAAFTGPEQVQVAKAQVQLAAARLKQAEAAFEVAELNLSYTTIRATINGVVSRRSVEVGNQVSPERPLLALVSLDDVWVVANYKESQLESMRPGQRAEVTTDVFGRHKFPGHVESLAGGTGARFALLPPDNASGNYVKVVQRVPVLIRLDPHPGFELRPGMSADSTVWIR